MTNVTLSHAEMKESAQIISVMKGYAGHGITAHLFVRIRQTHFTDAQEWNAKEIIIASIIFAQMIFVKASKRPAAT